MNTQRVQSLRVTDQPIFRILYTGMPLNALKEIKQVILSETEIIIINKSNGILFIIKDNSQNKYYRVKKAS
jgi:hypothetical protein